jgi:hypothetical protein
MRPEVRQLVESVARVAARQLLWVVAPGGRREDTCNARAVTTAHLPRGQGKTEEVPAIDRKG